MHKGGSILVFVKVVMALANYKFITEMIFDSFCSGQDLH